MQIGVAPGEVMDDDVVLVSQKVTAHERISRPSHGEGGLMAIPALPLEYNLDPVDYRLTINFLSIINNENNKGFCGLLYS